MIGGNPRPPGSGNNSNQQQIQNNANVNYDGFDDGPVRVNTGDVVLDPSMIVTDEFNEDLDIGLKIVGGAIKTFETGGAIGTFQELKNITLSTAKTAIKVVKGAGAISVITGGLVAAQEFAFGHDNTHTIVDLGVSVGGVVIVGVIGTSALPAVALGGLIYGIWSSTGGGDFIDNNFGYR